MPKSQKNLQVMTNYDDHSITMEGMSSVDITTEIDANFGTMSRRSTSKSLQKYGGKYANIQARLYIVIHEICGNSFAHIEAQRCLSILARCESVSVLATLENLNFPLLWDGEILNRFNWQYYHIPSYIDHPLPIDHPSLAETNDAERRFPASTNDGCTLDLILRAMTNNHINLIQIICEESIRGSNSEMRYMIPIQEILTKAQKKLIVRSKNELKSILKEFIDHDILQLVQFEGKEQIKLMLTKESILRYVKN